MGGFIFEMSCVSKLGRDLCVVFWGGLFMRWKKNFCAAVLLALSSHVYVMYIYVFTTHAWPSIGRTKNVLLNSSCLFWSFLVPSEGGTSENVVWVLSVLVSLWRYIYTHAYIHEDVSRAAVCDVRTCHQTPGEKSVGGNHIGCSHCKPGKKKREFGRCKSHIPPFPFRNISNARYSLLTQSRTISARRCSWA